MKQKKILFATLSVPFLLLSACGGGLSKLDSLEHGDNVLNENIIKANLTENKSYKEPQTIKYTVKQLTTTFAGYSVYNNFNYGISVLQNDSTYKYGVYSYFANKYLIDIRLEDDPSFESDEVFGCTMKYYDTDHKYYVADGAGNVLFKSDNYIYNYEIDYVTIENNLYSTARFESYDNTTIYFSYDQNGKATKIDKLPSAEAQEDPIPAGEIYRTKTYNFEKLGLDRYLTRYNSTLYVLYNKDGSAAKTIEIPYQSTAFVVGKKLIYQVSSDVGPNPSSYNYSYNGTYCSLKTYELNLETLEEAKEIKVGVVFTGGTPIKDENKAPKYSAVTLSEINSDGSLTPAKSYILDEELKLHDDITTKSIGSGTILHNGNIYTYTGSGYVLADKDCNPISSFSDINNLSINYSNETIRGYQYSSEGSSLFLCNNEGKLLVPTRTYSNNYFQELNNGFLKVRRLSDSKDVLYNTKEKKEIELTEGQSISGDIITTLEATQSSLSTTYNVSYTVVGETQPLKSYTNISSVPTNQGTFNRTFYNGAYKIISAYVNSQYEYHMFSAGTFAANAIPQPTAA